MKLFLEALLMEPKPVVPQKISLSIEENNISAILGLWSFQCKENLGQYVYRKTFFKQKNVHSDFDERNPAGSLKKRVWEEKQS